jgi:hypothetical protein
MALKGALMAIVLTLHAETAARGVWCDTCLLPTAVTVKLYTLCELGVFPPTTRTRCTRCKKAS